MRRGGRGLALGCVLGIALLAGAVAAPARAQAKPEGEMRWALYVTVPPAWFDPAEVVGVITPFWMLYALHDALVKPMPGNQLTPSLAESWTVSPDQKVYEFKLRQGVKFHNGDPFTAEDVKFSFHRAKAKLLHEKVKDVVVVDPAPGALRAPRALAGLHDLLRHLRVGGGLGGAEEVHRAGGRGRASGSTRSGSAPTSS